MNESQADFYFIIAAFLLLHFFSFLYPPVIKENPSMAKMLGLIEKALKRG